jgi:PmbA protein
MARTSWQQALAAGATDAECTISEGDEFSASVRMRELETLKEAGSRGAGLRILIGKRHTGSSYTSDLSPRGHSAHGAVGHRSGGDHHRRSARRPARCRRSGAPFRAIWGSTASDVRGLETELKIDMAQARRRRRAARRPAHYQFRRRVVRYAPGRPHFRQFARFRGRVSLQLLFVERGAGGARGRIHGARLLVHDGARLCRPGKPKTWAHRRERALRRLGAVKVETQKVPVVFEPRTARALLDNIFDAVHGGAIYRNESFLAGKLGERIASEKLTVIDDGTIPGLFGTSPFDDEGVPTRRTVVIENGVLRSYLLNTYTRASWG